MNFDLEVSLNFSQIVLSLIFSVKFSSITYSLSLMCSLYNLEVWNEFWDQEKRTGTDLDREGVANIAGEPRQCSILPYCNACNPSLSFPKVIKLTLKINIDLRRLQPL